MQGDWVVPRSSGGSFRRTRGLRLGAISSLGQNPDKAWDVVTRRLRELATASTGAVADAARSSLRAMESRAH